MLFIIQGKKYNTDNMEEVAEVKKWYATDTIWIHAAFPGKEVGREYPCKLWKSQKGNWLVTHEEDFTTRGEAITEEEAKGLLMRHAYKKYEELYGELEEA